MSSEIRSVILQFMIKISVSYLQILQNYGDILSKNQFLEDKSKLKSILDGLMRCLSLLPCNKGEDPSVKDVPSVGQGNLFIYLC